LTNDTLLAHNFFHLDTNNQSASYLPNPELIAEA
jgi:hypothetical protein